VCVNDKLLDSFTSTIGAKQGYPLWLTLIGLCIDGLEQMVNKFVQDKSIEEVTIGDIKIMFFLYIDNVMFFF
jgi:hypothetical protein